MAATRTLQTPAGRPLQGHALVGKFKILQEIGRGGMGVVYQGRKDLMPEEVKKALALNPYEVDAKIWWSNYHAANGDYASAKALLN